MMDTVKKSSNFMCNMPCQIPVGQSSHCVSQIWWHR